MQTPPQGFLKKRQGYATEPVRKLLLFFTPLRSVQLLAFILVLVFCQKISNGPWLQSLDNRVYDRFLQIDTSVEVSPAVVYIGIDRKSLQAIKPFPWPKRYYAAMTRILREWGAKAVVLNLFFSQAGDSEEENLALVEEFKRTPSLYLPISFESEGVKNYYYINQSEPFFSGHAKGIGHINYSPDDDKIIRRAYPFVKFNKRLYPHLGIQVAYDYLGKILPEPPTSDFPRDRNNNLLIHWVKPWDEVTNYYSFSDVLNSYALSTQGQATSIRPDDFKDKICLVGLTASDFKTTPLDAVSPGIGVTGSVINTILTGEFIRSPSPLTTLFMLLVVAVIAGFIFLPFRSVFSTIAGIVLAAGWIVFAFLIFSAANLWVGVATPALLILLYFLVSFTITKIAEYRERLRFLNLAVRDELTGLYAMRYVSSFLSQAMTYAQTFKKPFSVVIFDIDDFKKINDAHGYRTGNTVIKKVADVIQGSIRTKHRAVPDVAGRYGDEQFIVLLVGHNLATATFGVAERIRKAVDRLEFKVNDSTFKVTTSAGVAVLTSGEKNPARVVERAQEALLKAKASGKNQTCIQN